MPGPHWPDNSLGAAFHAFAIVPSDTVALGVQTKGIYIGTTGDLTLKCHDSATDVVFKTVPAGTVLHVNAQFVRAAGTTAANLVGLA
jgi:hypothetical protein